MQKNLFGDTENTADQTTKTIKPAYTAPDVAEIAKSLPSQLRLGTSSWNYPGWAGLVWGDKYTESALARGGLRAYAQHPLMRTVSIDRGFYRPLTAAQYAEYASQVGDDFRFVVKAPSIITDPLTRDYSGRGVKLNSSFLNAAESLQLFIEPALQGLGRKLGALVFQISPLPDAWLVRIPKLIDQLQGLLAAIPNLENAAPDAAIAVEVRDAQWLTPEFVHALRSTEATYCMGLHAKMPKISEQLPILRALWPGPLVCRWNLNPCHGAYGYENAKDLYDPFDKIIDPDLATRTALIRVIQGTAAAGQNVYVTISNKAEGSAPLSVIELARSLSKNA